MKFHKILIEFFSEQLIRSLQEQDHICAMVGDGANDCAALRNANCGLSLSSEESAVAAPFSTSHTNISVYKYLICEGKATISATFGAFKVNDKIVDF